MQHLNEYPDAIKCIKNRRYTPAASFMMETMVEKAAHRISTEQRTNLTTAIARKLRNTHTRLLRAQSGGVALRAMAEQAYRDVEGEMASTGGSKASAPAAA
jgi:PBP1b-binding outer membrane lipoprotein LpoB